MSGGSGGLAGSAGKSKIFDFPGCQGVEEETEKERAEFGSDWHFLHIRPF